MRKGIFTSVILLLLLCSCATTVSFNSLVPSEVNLGANQVIAVSSTNVENTPFWFYSYVKVLVENGIPVPDQIKMIPSRMGFTTVYKAADYASSALFSSLSDGVYQIVRPSVKNLKTQGITLVMDSSIDAVTYDEYIMGKAFTDEKGKKYYNYYLVQKASLSLSYRLTDVESNRVVDAKAYAGQYPYFGYENATLVARLTEDNVFTMYDYSGTEAELIFRKIIDSFRGQIRDRLIPHYVTLSFNLLDTKEYSSINKLINQGYLSIGFDQYMDIYQKTGDIVAGYNCAVLYYAMGNQEAAIALAQGIYKSTLNADVGKLLQKMQNAYNVEQMAKGQAGLL